MCEHVCRLSDDLRTFASSLLRLLQSVQVLFFLHGLPTLTRTACIFSSGSL